MAAALPNQSPPIFQSPSAVMIISPAATAGLAAAAAAATAAVSPSTQPGAVALRSIPAQCSSVGAAHAAGDQGLSTDAVVLQMAAAATASDAVSTAGDAKTAALSAAPTAASSASAAAAASSSSSGAASQPMIGGEAKTGSLLVVQSSDQQIVGDQAQVTGHVTAIRANGANSLDLGLAAIGAWAALASQKSSN